MYESENIQSKDTAYPMLEFNRLSMVSGFYLFLFILPNMSSPRSLT
jgi:hypothetical protein